MVLLKIFIFFALFLSLVDSDELTGRCQGAGDGQYYIDNDMLYPTPRCCKCSKCEFYGHQRTILCDGPNNCISKSAHCYDEQDFNDYIKVTTTKPPPNTTVSVPLQVSATTQSFLESSAVQPTADPMSPFLIALIALIVIILLLLIFIWKMCRKSSKKSCFRSTFLKLKTCIGIETKKGIIESTNRDASENLIKEQKVFISEAGNSPANHCSSMYQSSSTGPRGIRVENGLLQSQESRPFSCPSTDFTDYGYDSNGPNNVRVSDPNENIRVNGNGNLVINSKTNGGDVNIGNVYVINSREGEIQERIFNGLPDQPKIPDNISRGVTVQNNPSDQHEWAEEDARATQTSSRQTFPTPVSGIKYVTSLSAPLGSRVSDLRIPSSAAHHPLVRRQSSEISSTSAGPVENQINDGLTSSSCQESIAEVCVPPIHQYNSRRQDSNWSQIYSHRNGPVQHMDSCDRFVPFRGAVRQISDEDSSISIALPSESDCKEI